MYLAGKAGGYSLQDLIWEYLEEGVIELHQHSEDEPLMMSRLMHQYQNVPMDLADASLMAAAENRGDRSLFTLDSDFRIYRLHDGGMLDIVPE